MSVDVTIGLGDAAGIVMAICAVFGAVAAVGLFAIRMIVRGEIATLVDRLVEKYQTKEACRAIREDCAKLHRLERGQHGQNDKECGA